MIFDVPESELRRAKSPHELAMVNLLLLNLPALIALLGGSFLQPDSPLAPYRRIGVALPMSLSLAVVAFGFWRARRASQAGTWFVAAHWRLANRRYKALVVAYGAGAVLIWLGWLIAQTQTHPGLQALMFIALQRVAVAPMLVALMVLVVLESGSIYQAQRGEVPDWLVRSFPPSPELLAASENARSELAAEDSPAG